MTIVPPLPHEAIADVIAGTSSIEAEPPAAGVQDDARAWLCLVLSGRARDEPKSAKTARAFVIDMAQVFQGIAAMVWE
jgi:hypothetical protein